MDVAVKRAPHLVSAHVRRLGVLSDLGRCRDAKAAMRSLREVTQAPEALDVAAGALSRCK
jgi:hypothetical protein